MRLLLRDICFMTDSLSIECPRHVLTVEFVLDTGETVAYEAVADLSAIEPK